MIVLFSFLLFIYSLIAEKNPEIKENIKGKVRMYKQLLFFRNDEQICEKSRKDKTSIKGSRNKYFGKRKRK